MKNSVTINGQGQISFTYNGQKYDAAKAPAWPHRWTVSYQGEVQAVSSDLGTAVEQVCREQDQLAALLPTVATGIAGLTVPVEPRVTSDGPWSCDNKGCTYYNMCEVCFNEGYRRS